MPKTRLVPDVSSYLPFTGSSPLSYVVLLELFPVFSCFCPSFSAAQLPSCYCVMKYDRFWRYGPRRNGFPLPRHGRGMTGCLGDPDFNTGQSVSLVYRMRFLQDWLPPLLGDRWNKMKWKKIKKQTKRRGKGVCGWGGGKKRQIKAHFYPGMRAHWHTRASKYVQLCTRVCTLTHTYARTHTWHTHARTHARARTHSRTHARTHARTHTHTHTQTPPPPSPDPHCTQPPPLTKIHTRARARLQW